MKRKIILWVLTLCLIVTLMPLAGVKASAATDKASALVTNALRYQGKSLSGVKTAMKNDKYSIWRSDYTGAWCAWYVSQCAKNVGAASLIPANTFVFDVAKNVAGAGGKITCIDRAYYNKRRTEYGVNRTFYDAAYKPRKGDLVIFAEGTATAHIGIVTANSSNPKSISTVEGNSGGGSGKVVYYSSRSYSSGGQHIAAYVTPNYTNTYYLAYSDGIASTKNDSTVIPTQTVKRGVSTQTTTKKFSRSGYTYSQWYILKYDADGYANYWCRDKATGQKTAWYRYDKIPSGYYKVAISHGGKIYFNVATKSTIYLTPVWVKSTSSSAAENNNTYRLVYSDGVATTKNDSSIIPAQTIKRGVKTNISTKKFTRKGYSYSAWYLVKVSNGKNLYWCKDKATKKKGGWYSAADVPKTYYRVTLTKTISFSPAAGSTLYLTPVWVKNKSTSTSSSSTARKKTYKTSGLTMPYTLVKGTSYSLSGTVTSTNKYKITSGTVGVYNSKGKAVYAKKLSNNSKTLKISRFDKYIKFGKLKSGTYYYKIKIKRNGKTATILNHKVKVNYSNYVYYSDKYNGYTYQQFGWTRFKEQGCYVTSAAMVISNKRGKKITPDMVHKNLGMRIGTICPDTPDWDTLARKNGLKGGICKTSSRGFNVDQIKAFAKKYPQGVMCDNGKHMFVARYNSTFDLYFNDPAADGPRGYSVAAKDHLKKLSSIYNKNNNKNVVNRMIALY